LTPGHISADKNLSCRYTTAAFTISPESGVPYHMSKIKPVDLVPDISRAKIFSFSKSVWVDPSHSMDDIVITK
jgi:hypothetical protein